MGDLLSLAVALPPGLPHDQLVHIARLAGRLGFSAVHVPESAQAHDESFRQLCDAADPALVVIDSPLANRTQAPPAGLVYANDPELVTRERARLDADGATRPLLVHVPISIGRTLNEAVARADREPRFQGERHPRHSGIFGTFEQAQEQVLALAEAGADGLVVEVPTERDVADILAQVRALVVGATPALLGQDRPFVPPTPTVFYPPAQA